MNEGYPTEVVQARMDLLLEHLKAVYRGELLKLPRWKRWWYGAVSLGYRLYYSVYYRVLFRSVLKARPEDRALQHPGPRADG